MGEVTVKDRGRIVIPKFLREKLDIKGGEKMEVKEENGEIVLKPSESTKPIKDLKGCIEGSKIDPINVKEIWDE